VTKQNFRSRHLHADLEKSPTIGSKSSLVTGGKKAVQKESTGGRLLPLVHPPTMSEDLLQRAPNGEVGPSVCEAIGAQTGVEKSISCSDLEQTHEPSESDTALAAGDKATGVVRKKRKQFGSSPSSQKFDRALGVVGRRRRWSSLLRERPHELSAINEWLSQVIAASDPSTPFAFTDESLIRGTIPAEGSILQQSLWDELLVQRPNNLHSCKTDWLVKVLQISSPEFDSAVACFSRGESEKGDNLFPPAKIANAMPLVENNNGSSPKNGLNVDTSPAKKVKTVEAETETGESSMVEGASTCCV
jgi:hypothetical protein